MREAIKRVIAELEESNMAMRVKWIETDDEYYIGAMDANEETIIRLKEVLTNE